MGATSEIEDEVKEAKTNAADEHKETSQMLNQAAETAETTTDSAKPAESVLPQPMRNKLIRRITLVVIALLLAGAAYIKREPLIRLFYVPTSEESPSATQTATTERKVLYWVDPMHPSYKSDKPGIAPDCGMNLVPVYADGGQASTNLPEGAFQISPDKQQLIGVTYGVTTAQRVSRSLRTVGRLAYDETKINHVHTKIEGWIEDVFVDFTGKFIEKGRPLLTVYSPDLLQTQQEYLLAMRGRTEIGASPFKEASAGAQSLYEAARRRLELWDVSEAEIKELERTGKPVKAITLYAPATGFVLTRNAFTKQRVMPDTDLYSIADLSTIWVLADVYEYEASDISVGQSATVTLPYLPGQVFQGKVTYIYPQVDSTTRTLKARIEVENPRFELKPDMYANVEFQIDYGRHVVVPAEAVMDSGSEQTVFVALNDGYFEPRKIQLGAKVDNKFVVLAGLKPGERIVTSGNFLIDSESKLKSAAAGMGMPGMDHGASGNKPEQVDHSQHQRGEKTPAKSEDHSQHQSGPAASRPAQVDHSQNLTKPNNQPQVDNSKHQTSDADQVLRSHQSATKRKILYWYSQMHPQYKSEKPAKCPICAVDMVPKYADE